MTKLGKSQLLFNVVGLFLFASAASAHPLEDLGFSSQQVRALIEACIGADLNCQVLTRNLDGEVQRIVLVGERHTQARSEFERGSQLLRLFDLVGVEPTEDRRARESSFVAGAYIKMMGWKSQYPNTLMRYQDSRDIFNLEKGGTDFGLVAYVRGNLALCAGIVCFSTALVSDQLVLAVPGSFLAIGGVVEHIRAERQLQAEGPLSHFQMKNRDRLIAQNILFVLDQSRQTQMAAVMGVGHLYGVTKNLRASGFTNRSKELLQEYQIFIKETGINYGNADLRFGDWQRSERPISKLGLFWIEKVHSEDLWWLDL
jgi:hypothetical protein